MLNTQDDLPRPEYPRPQFQRKDWLNLNGTWQFEKDFGDTGFERGLLDKELLDQQILVPFCPESKLSGIEYVDYMDAVWYRREVLIPSEWEGREVHLHFGAVDYETTVWVNGVEVYRHRGGFTSFTCYLNGVVGPGERATIVVRARDLKCQPKAAGKQSLRYGNYGCFYTRTTGIWQTVWMEPVPSVFLKRPRITPHFARRRFIVEQPLSRNVEGHSVRGTLYWKGKEIARETVGASEDFSPLLELHVPADECHPWEPGKGNLYELKLELIDAKGVVLDQADSYAGLRAISLHGTAVKINGKVVFQRQVLDQGFYVEGIMTAPSDEALIQDIKMAMDAGFNSARICQKVFEERFHYHADRLGYMTWAEFPDWGLWGEQAQIFPKDHNPFASAIAQWGEAIDRDYSHPSIIGWCGLCESPQPEGRADSMTARDDLMAGMFNVAKAFDKTRPVIDTSGHVHRMAETDILDTHEYEQDPVKLDELLQEGAKDLRKRFEGRSTWPWVNRGQPFFVSEFGGIKWNPKFATDEDPGQEISWGYGTPPKTLEEFYTRLEGQCRVILSNPNIFGFTYTQLTDTFQEQNGIYFFDRSLKFDTERVRQAFRQPAAIEDQRQANA